jgi:hypothetical protein
LKYVTEVQHGQHRGEYEAFAKKYAPFPEAVSLEMIDAYKHTADIDINDLTIMQDHFVMTGSQKKFVPFDQVIDLSYLKEAKKK